MVAVAILGSGISQLYVMDGRSMFADKDSWVEKDRDLYYEYFGQPFRNSLVFFLDKQRTQILTTQKLLQVQRFLASVQGGNGIPPTFVVNYENERNLTYTDLCFQPIQKLNVSKCVQTSNVMSMFMTQKGNDLMTLNDTQVVQRIRQGTPPSLVPVMKMFNMQAYIFPHILFGSKTTVPELITINPIDGTNNIDAAQGTA